MAKTKANSVVIQVKNLGRLNRRLKELHDAWVADEEARRKELRAAGRKLQRRWLEKYDDS